MLQITCCLRSLALKDTDSPQNGQSAEAPASMDRSIALLFQTVFFGAFFFAEAFLAATFCGAFLAGAFFVAFLGTFFDFAAGFFVDFFFVAFLAVDFFVTLELAMEIHRLWYANIKWGCRIGSKWV